MGPIILREKNMGYCHTENTCQVGLKDLERQCDEKKKKNKKILRLKRLLQSTKIIPFLHKYMSIEKGSSWYP